VSLASHPRGLSPAPDGTISEERRDNMSTENLSAVKCPVCGGDSLTIQEQVWTKRTIIGRKPDGSIVARGEWTIIGESAEGPLYTFCSDCMDESVIEDEELSKIEWL
jgi:hypothetical protein